MSNKITIEPTKFENVRTGVITYGYRAYDNYDQAYGNTFDSIPDDDLDFLSQVNENADQNTSEMLCFVKENQCGLFIGSEWYDYEDIKETLEEK